MFIFFISHIQLINCNCSHMLKRADSYLHWLPSHGPKNSQLHELVRLDFLICDALRDLVSFVQLLKREKHPWTSVTFSKVAGFHFFLIVQMVPNRATHHISSKMFNQVYFVLIVTFNLIFSFAIFLLKLMKMISLI